MADERKYYCFCDSNCKFETLTREQILTAIEQAVKTGEIHDVDSGFITTVKTVNNKSVKFFFGTEAEYNALGEDVRANLIPYKTDHTIERYIESKINEAKAETVPRMGVIDVAAQENKADRIYCQELDEILLGEDRAYVEGKNGGGLMRSVVLTSNATKVYNPYGYASIEAMCAAHAWNIGDIKENEHYIIKTIDGAPSYHPWISTIVQRQRNGNVRTGTPSDSSDTTPKSYIDTRLGGAAVKAETNSNSNHTTIPLRDTKGEIRCKIDDTNGFSGDACVNKTYLNGRIGGAAVKAQYHASTEVDTIPLRNKNGEIHCKVTDDSQSTVCVNKSYLQAKALNAITILNGDENTAGSVKKTVADAIAQIVASAPADFDTLKEMSDWISSHSTSAAAMNSAIQSNTSAISAIPSWAKAANKPSYAFSEIEGTLSYNSLGDKPTLFSGSYNDLTDKPTLFSGSYNDLSNKPTLFSGSYNDLSNKPTLFSGSYNDLTDKPTIPTEDDIKELIDTALGGIVSGEY